MGRIFRKDGVDACLIKGCDQNRVTMMMVGLMVMMVVIEMR